MRDALSDMLARIRNGYMRRGSRVLVPASNFLLRVLDVLVREGYIEGYDRVASEHSIRENFSIRLKYSGGSPAIVELKRVSKPGRRVYVHASDIPVVFNGLGVSVLTTPKGVVSDAVARKENVGGELLFTVF